MTLKRAAILYLAAGAGVAAWSFMKGYQLDLGTVALWPLRVKQVYEAPNYTSTNGMRAQLVFS